MFTEIPQHLWTHTIPDLAKPINVIEHHIPVTNMAPTKAAKDAFTPMNTDDCFLLWTRQMGVGLVT